MPDNSMTEVVEILRFSGGAAKGLFKGIGLTLKGVKWTGSKASILKTKFIIARSFKKSAYETRLNLLSEKTLDKYAGDNTRIIRIPSEDQEDIVEFANMLKKRKVHACLLDDLNIGDGKTEFKVAGDDMEFAKSCTEAFEFYMKNKHGIEAKCEEITFDEYFENADSKQLKEYISETADQLEKESKTIDTPSLTPKETNEKLGKIIDLNNLKAKFESKDYFKFSVPANSVVAESPNGYGIKVPNSYDSSKGDCLIMGVEKNNTRTDKEGNLEIAIPKESKSNIRSSKSKDNQSARKVDNKDLFKKYFNNDMALDKTETKANTKEKVASTPKTKKK